MSDTMQSLDQLSSLKVQAPDAPTYVKKIDKQGRAYSTGKRKDAVARVWIKPAPARSSSTPAKSKSTSLVPFCAC